MQDKATESNDNDYLIINYQVYKCSKFQYCKQYYPSNNINKCERYFAVSFSKILIIFCLSIIEFVNYRIYLLKPIKIPFLKNMKISIYSEK